MRQSAETENLMTSVERALEYSKIESEAALESTPGNFLIVNHNGFNAYGMGMGDGCVSNF